MEELYLEDVVDTDENINVCDTEHDTVEKFSYSSNGFSNPIFNDVVREDVKEYLLKDLDTNPDIANTVIGLALSYMMSGVGANKINPWVSWNENANYLSDIFDYAEDDNAIKLWEINHPGYKYPLH